MENIASCMDRDERIEKIITMSSKGFAYAKAKTSRSYLKSFGFYLGLAIVLIGLYVLIATIVKPGIFNTFSVVVWMLNVCLGIGIIKNEVNK